ncbi:hypothetical protein CXQ81_03950 [Pseudomonas sp. 09C 129]|uniref:hypothetical protein n=1 Tax=Pseudomonas sp. 09C 129 TaxID=2054915 RepID=UPI000C6E9C5B|nr:hypothetical protein [Pseudomonas sp. 09C 129]AUF99778.1 hypothetical protein CXQ81_03950 [Pseudomonas sp. 09C 129]
MQAQTPEVSTEQATTPAPELRLVSVEQLKKIHRDLDACQKVIWLAGCRPRVPNGFAPSYVTDAQDRLKEIETLLAASMPAALQGLDDTARLDFMLEKHRKVVVELIPGKRHEVYVEEGFMSDKQYPAVIHTGDWANGTAAVKELKRKAIDAAIAVQAGQEAPHA